MISGVYVICELIFVPGTIMSIGTGFALQQAFKNTAEAMVFGCPAIFIGGCIGAMISFFLGRYVFQSCA